MKNILTPLALAKRVLAPLGLTAAASGADATIHKKMFGSGVTTLINSNEEMNDIIKIVKSLEESVKKQLAKQLKIKQKNKHEDFSECYETL